MIDANLPPEVVKVHCGSAHVKGTARKYPYLVASLFVLKTTKAGKNIYVNSGYHTSPRRSMQLAEDDGRAFAAKHNAVFVTGYGSLHHKTNLS